MKGGCRPAYLLFEQRKREVDSNGPQRGEKDIDQKMGKGISIHGVNN